MSENEHGANPSGSAEYARLERAIEDELVGAVKSAAALRVEADEIGLVLSLRAEMQRMLDPDAVAEAVQGVVLRLRASRGLSVPMPAEIAWVALVIAESLPDTSSRNEQRALCAKLWREGALPTFAMYRDGQRVAQATAAQGPDGVRDQTAADVERVIAAIWQDVLKVPVHESDVSFFALRGSSLAAAHVVLQVQERLGVAVPGGLLFQAPTLRAFSEAVARIVHAGERAELAPLVRLPRDGALPLASAQARMRFLWELDPSSAAYNVCGALRLEGALDVVRLKTALDALVERHEVLRTRFPARDGIPYPQVDAPSPLRLVCVEAGGRSPAEREQTLRALVSAETEAPFDLSNGPLIRALLVRIEAEKHVLL
ncbi:MAG TPA: condensation domain-containing protein, partial [Polyangiales bacterium]|nr:condensation domain-containing protein [Polyangiales bacterium]